MEPLPSSGENSSRGNDPILAGPIDFCMEWNAENQLKRVLKNAVEQARFAYDPMRRRVEKIAGGMTTTFTYDLGNILRLAGGGTTLKYIHGPAVDEPLASDDGSVLSYLHADALGSVTRTTDANAAVLLSRRYDAWGQVESGATTSGYAFTGREWDSEANLHYYRARYYDPKIGRFISEDPIGVADDINRYAYVGNSPTNRVDPTGLWAAGVGGGAGAALVPPLPMMGFTGDANCQVVVDDDGNVGLLCCAEGGPALGGFVGFGGQASGTICPSCDTICDLEDWSVQVSGGGAKGGGMMASGGPFLNAVGVGVTGSVGPAAGVGGFGGIQFGGCKLFWQRKPCANSCSQ